MLPNWILVIYPGTMIYFIMYLIPIWVRLWLWLWSLPDLAWNGTDYTVIPGGTGSYGATNNYIAEGQAFFVRGTGNIQLTEGAKTAAITGTMPFTPVNVPHRRHSHSILSVYMRMAMQTL